MLRVILTLGPVPGTEYVCGAKGSRGGLSVFLRVTVFL